METRNSGRKGRLLMKQHDNGGKYTLFKLLSALVAIAVFLTLVTSMWILFGTRGRQSWGDKAARPKPITFFEHSKECFRAPFNPLDRRKDKSRLKIVNFNVEWLFLYGGLGNIKCPAESCPWVDSFAAIDHIGKIANVLASIDADIIHLSEVEDCRVLEALISMLPKGHGYKPYLIAGRDQATGQNVGLLTRVDPISDMRRTEKRGTYPVPDSTCEVRKKGTIGVTKHYVIPFNMKNANDREYSFLFSGVHFLARPNDKYRCAQREGQAGVLRDLIRSLSGNNEKVVIMGDFNDYDELAPGADGRKPMTNVLKTLYSSSGSGRKLVNAASLIPQKERYSCWFDVNQNCRVDGSHELAFIDHVLYDADLKVQNVKIHHELVPLPTCQSRISDHWPISITFGLE